MRRSWVIVGILCLMPTLAVGQVGWGTAMKGGPFLEFRGEDWSIFQSAVVRAAEGLPNDVSTWSNAKTKAHGDVKVIKQSERPGLGECRDLRGQASARGRTGPFAITLCRQPGQQWKIAG